MNDKGIGASQALRTKGNKKSPGDRERHKSPYLCIVKLNDRSSLRDCRSEARGNKSPPGTQTQQ